MLWISVCSAHQAPRSMEIMKDVTSGELRLMILHPMDQEEDTQMLE